MVRIVLAAGVAVAASTATASAEEQFVGRWAVKSDLCSSHGGETPETSALVATDTSLWWYEGYCRIGKMYKTTAVYVQAHCSGKDVGVSLDPKGDRMKVVWGGKAQELRRCP